MFRKGNGFPDSAESITFTENFFCSDVLQLSSEYVFPAKISKFVKLLWGPFSVVNYSSQVVQGISVRQNDAWRQWPLWPTCDRCYRTKRGQGEVSDQRGPTNYIIWVYGSIAPVRYQTSWPRNRGEVEWSGVFTCFENVAETGQSGSGTWSLVTRLLYTSMTQKPSSSLQSGFFQLTAHLWNLRDREALPNRRSRSSSPNPVLLPLFYSRREDS